jgi:hypothetical protein
MTSPETLNPDPVEANSASGAVTSPVPAEANLWQATRSPVSLLVCILKEDSIAYLRSMIRTPPRIQHGNEKA